MGGEGVSVSMGSGVGVEMMTKWEQSLCQRSEAIAIREELLTQRERRLAEQSKLIAGQHSTMAYQEQVLAAKIQEVKEIEKDVMKKEQGWVELSKQVQFLERELDRFQGKVIMFNDVKRERESLVEVEKKLAKEQKMVEMMGKMLKIGVVEYEKMKKEFHKKRMQECKLMQRMKEDWANKVVETVKTFQECLEIGVGETLAVTLLLENIRVFFQQLSVPHAPQSPLRPHPFL